MRQQLTALRHDAQKATQAGFEGISELVRLRQGAAEDAAMLPQIVVFDGSCSPCFTVDDIADDKTGRTGHPAVGGAWRGHNNSPIDA